MANPNRTVARWRRSNPTYELVAEYSVTSSWEGEDMAEELRATGKYARVVSTSYKMGPRLNPIIYRVVRCYKRIGEV